MPGRQDDMAAVRREILDLLRLQIEALDSPLGLTDARLTECYERQARVQELREKLQALTGTMPDQTAPSFAAQATPVSVDTVANV